MYYMNKYLNLLDLLKFENNYYIGNCFYVDLDNKYYSFIKGRLISNPKFFKHPLYKSKYNQSAAYILREIFTGKIYIGSSKEVYERISVHKFLMKRKEHDNSNFTELLKITKIENFELVIIFTDSREEAYDIEQFIVNYFKNSDLLLNIANDVRFARLGAINTKEHIEAIRLANTGKIATEETKKLMSDFHKTDEKAIQQFKDILESKKRKVMVNGIAYDSLIQAGKNSGINETKIRNTLRQNNNSDIYWLSHNLNKLENTRLSDEQRLKLSLYRQTSRAKEQFQLCQEANKRKILLNGVMYKSVQDAVLKTGISEPTIHRKLKLLNGKCNKEHYILNYNVPIPRKVIINNIIYDSVSIAAKEIGRSISFIKGQIRSGKIKCIKN